MKDMRKHIASIAVIVENMELRVGGRHALG